MELWRTCVRAPDYEVSNLGNIRRATPGKRTYVGRPIRPATNGRYLTVSLMINGRLRTVAVAPLIADAFLPPRPSAQHTVNHINGSRTDNRAVNLEWATMRAQMRHAYRVGLQKPFHAPQVGVTNGRARLTESDVRAIRAAAHDVSDAQLAAQYGVSPGTVWFARTGRTWRHMT